MNVRVQYFGIIADMANRKEEVVTLPENATVGNPIESLSSTHPKFAALKRQVRPVSNGKNQKREDLLEDGDEIAFVCAIGRGS